MATVTADRQPAEASAGGGQSPLALLLHQLFRRRLVLAAAGLLGAIIVVALLAPWITPYDPQKMDIINRLKPPGSAHWFGSDEFGRDVLARVMLGAR
ncbi:MAG: peptide transporter permease, partial [Geminicoccaceae bacterium]|nr:peptide transporter permease [Geminicoccaceae bacterium]